MRKLKTKKSKTITITLIIIFIFFFTIGVGYSYLQQRINIYGKATIVTDESGKYIKGNSTYSYEIINSQNSDETNYTIYDVKLKIINMDTDIDLWQVAFDVPEGYNDAMSNIKENSSKKCENGRLTIYSKDENGYLAKGSTLELEVQLAINGDFDIKNLT